MGQNLGDHVGLGGGREAGDGGHGDALALRQFLDEAGGIEIVGPEVMTPFGQAVRLVEDPAADLTRLQHPSERDIAQLLRGAIEDGDLAQADSFQHLAALRSGQQAVECRRVEAPGLEDQIVHLILHQGLQRREHERQLAAAQITHQGRQLEAQRLAAAGGQDGELRAVRHPVGDDGALKTAAVGVPGFRPELRQAEPALELAVRVMDGAAPDAIRRGAGPIAQGLQERLGLGKAVPDPGRQHRAGTRHLEPGGRIGQGRAQARVAQMAQSLGLGRGPADPAIPIAVQQVQHPRHVGQIDPQRGEDQRHPGAAGGR